MRHEVLPGCAVLCGRGWVVVRISEGGGMSLRKDEIYIWLLDIIYLIFIAALGALLTHALHSYEKDVDRAIKELERRAHDE